MVAFPAAIRKTVFFYINALVVPAEFPLPEHGDIKVDHKVNMEVKRNRKNQKFWRSVERISIFV